VDFLSGYQGIGIINFTQMLNLLSLNLPCHRYLYSGYQDYWRGLSKNKKAQLRYFLHPSYAFAGMTIGRYLIAGLIAIMPDHLLAAVGDNKTPVNQ